MRALDVEYAAPDGAWKGFWGTFAINMPLLPELGGLTDDGQWMGKRLDDSKVRRDGLPSFERSFQSILNGAYLRARPNQLRHVENAVGARRFHSLTTEFLIIRPIGEWMVRLENSVDQVNDLPGRDGARVSYIINAEGSGALPKVQARADAITQ